jgi:hypothetical protein
MTTFFALLLAQDLRVSTDFPGGSAEVLAVDAAARRVTILPANHPERGWRCWWYFKLSGLKVGETVVIDVGDAPWATPDRAVTGIDDREWVQTPPGKRSGKRIAYPVEAKAPVQWFAWGPPFTLRHAQDAVAAAVNACPGAKAFELARTRHGRSVPAVRVGAADGFGVWIQARQHAWESGGSWVGRGFLEWLCSDDDRAAALRKRAEVVVVPLMDVDNAERGAGGKGAVPQDHNRDWSDAPHHPEVAAAQAGIRALDAAGRFDVFVDLHNPGASDPTFFYMSPKADLSEAGRRNHEALYAAAGALFTTKLGKVRESGADYDPKNWMKISKNWVTRTVKPHAVAVTLETAWNHVGSGTEFYLRTGRELGLSIERILVPGFRP